MFQAFQNRKRRTLTTLLVASFLICALGLSAQAVTFFRSTVDVATTFDELFADVVAEPNSAMWWDQATITFKIDPTFTAVWTDPLHQALIRSAFNQWGQAAARDYGTVNSHYVGAVSPLYDLGTIALHELGHGVGFGHPFQGEEILGTPINRNYHFDGWDAGMPYDGTQTWLPEADTLGEVMGYGPLGALGMLPGTVNRTLSWDELNGTRYLYGGFGPMSNSGLNFLEVDPALPADIVVRAADLTGTPYDGALAYMPAVSNMVTPGDPTAGAVIQSSEMIFNSAYAADIGHVPGLFTSAWNLRLPSIPFLYPYGIQMWVNRGGATLLSQTSGTTGNHHLEDFSADDAVDPAIYTWLNPSNNHPLVGPTIIGMEFDLPVTPLIAFTTDEQGNILDVLPATLAEPFKHTGLPEDDGGPWANPLGMYAVETTVLEEGIKLKGSEEAPSLLTRIRLANAGGMNLQLGDLNDDLLELLDDGLDDLCVSCLGDVILGGAGPEHILLFSDGTNLTSEMLTDPSYAYHILDMPEVLLYDELLVVMDSEMEMLDGSILEHRSFSLLGRTVTGVALALLPGDVDGDGFVGGDDLTIVLSNWGLDGQTREQGDLTGDGFIGGDDYSEVLSYWGTGTQAQVTAVPEPATLALLVFGGLILLKRRTQSA